MRVFCSVQGENNPCIAGSYLFTYSLPDRYSVGYPGSELPDNGSPTHQLLQRAANKRLPEMTNTRLSVFYLYTENASVYRDNSYLLHKLRCRRCWQYRV